ATLTPASGRCMTRKEVGLRQKEIGEGRRQRRTRDYVYPNVSQIEPDPEINSRKAVEP
ncbi:hypothetical protein BaRGS_00017474, partial [Batillaria attramentaria]